MLVSHVNKFNELTGPRAMAHLVDVVIYIDPFGQHIRDFEPEVIEHLSSTEIETLRVIRHDKNRFGPPGVRAILEMTSHGLSTPARSISRLAL